MSIPASLMGNYNISETLRRVTVIIRKVEADIDLYEVYKKLHIMRDIINQEVNP